MCDTIQNQTSGETEGTGTAGALRSDASLALGLLEAAAVLHGGAGAGGLDAWVVDTIERVCPGAAAAIFGELDGGGLLALTAAGPRWRTAERQEPAWLSREWRTIATRLRVSDHPWDPVRVWSPAGAAHVLFVPLPVSVPERTTLVTVWSAPDEPPARAGRLLAGFARHIGLARARSGPPAALAPVRAGSADDGSRQQRAERLAALGQLSRGLGHDLNNALTTIVGTAECLAMGVAEGSSLRIDLDRMRDAALDASTLVRRVQGLAPAPATSGREVCDLVELVESALDIARARLAGQPAAPPIELRVEASSRPLVRVNPREWRELILHLTSNAIEAMPAGGRIGIRVDAEHATACVDVSDEGCGVSDALAPHVFDPFVTTKARRGAGIGLSVCWAVAHAHGGRIDLVAGRTGGTTVRVSLPLADGGTASQAAPPSARVERRDGPLAILIVDDQEEVRMSIGDMLAVLGHTVRDVASAREALDVLGAAPFDLVLTDYAMPGMSGIDLAREVRIRRPDVPVVLLTGFGGVCEPDPEHGASVVLFKPVTLHALRQALADAMTGSHGGAGVVAA
jgi:signal transduction histidine kinase/ActR/RegA family two-component response regulator